MGVDFGVVCGIVEHRLDRRLHPCPEEQPFVRIDALPGQINRHNVVASVEAGRAGHEVAIFCERFYATDDYEGRTLLAALVDLPEVAREHLASEWHLNTFYGRSKQGRRLVKARLHLAPVTMKISSLRLHDEQRRSVVCARPQICTSCPGNIATAERRVCAIFHARSQVSPLSLPAFCIAIYDPSCDIKALAFVTASVDLAAQDPEEVIVHVLMVKVEFSLAPLDERCLTVCHDYGGAPYGGFYIGRATVLTSITTI